MFRNLKSLIDWTLSDGSKRFFLLSNHLIVSKVFDWRSIKSVDNESANIIMVVVCIWNNNDFVYENYILNGSNNTLYNVYSSMYIVQLRVQRYYEKFWIKNTRLKMLVWKKIMINFWISIWLIQRLLYAKFNSFTSYCMIIMLKVSFWVNASKQLQLLKNLYYLGKTWKIILNISARKWELKMSSWDWE